MCVCHFKMTINITSHCKIPKVFITKMGLRSFSNSTSRNTSNTCRQQQGSCSCMPGSSIRRNLDSIAAKIYYHVLELNIVIILHPNYSAPPPYATIFSSPLCIPSIHSVSVLKGAGLSLVTTKHGILS